MILDKILKTKKEEVAQLMQTTSKAKLQKQIAGLVPCRHFKKALNAGDCNIIAEVKCASPSRGRLTENFHPVGLAVLYEQNGASAVSVLTDENFFRGHKNDLLQIRSKVQLPLLRKDFIIDPLQIYETRVLGADAVLLIVRILQKKLADFISLSRDTGLQPLVEVHTEEELDIALAAGADIIGINNRNLDTFVTEIETSLRLVKQIPADKMVVAESGISSRQDLARLIREGIHAFLIGEHLVTAPDIGKKLRELKGERT